MIAQRAFLALFFGTIAVNTHAYLDPGTGSMILQGLIAGIAVGWFTIKTYWYKIASFFGKTKPYSILDDDADLDLDEPQK